MKCSFENALVERESSIGNEWLSQRIALYNQFEYSPS